MSKILSGELIGKKESVQNQLLLLNPHQTPMISMLGFGKPASNVAHIWFEDSMFSLQSNVTKNALAGDTTLPVAETEPFRPNQIVKVGDELLLVTGIDLNDKTITVLRGYANTTPIDISLGDIIQVQFVEGVEGADAREGRYKTRTKKSNITQIFDETIELTGTAMAVSNYGIDDLYEYEKQKRQLELVLQLEKALISGIKYEQGLVRQMDGIKSFINTNVTDLNGTPLTLDILSDSIQAIYDKGGFKTGGEYEIIVPARQKRAINLLDSSLVRINQGDDKRGTVVNFITTDFGEFPVSINDNLSPDEILIIDKHRVTIRPLKDRAFTHEFLGKKGDYVQGAIVGEYTLEFVQEAAHARIKGAK